MIQVGENLHLSAKSPADSRSSQTRFYQFYCDFLAVVFVVTKGKINSAHSSLTKLAQDSIGADTTPYLRRSSRRIKSQPSRVGGTLLHHVAVQIYLMLEQQLHFGLQVAVPLAGGGQEDLLALRLILQSFMK